MADKATSGSASCWQAKLDTQIVQVIANRLIVKLPEHSRPADLVLLDESFAALDPENLRRALTCVLQRVRTRSSLLIHEIRSDQGTEVPTVATDRNARSSFRASDEKLWMGSVAR